MQVADAIARGTHEHVVTRSHYQRYDDIPASVPTSRMACAANLSVVPQSPSPTLESNSSSSAAASINAAAATDMHRSSNAACADSCAGRLLAAESEALVLAKYLGARGSGAGRLSVRTAAEWFGQPGACAEACGGGCGTWGCRANCSDQGMWSRACRPSCFPTCRTMALAEKLLSWESRN